MLHNKSESLPLTTFHRFNDLPKEIRLAIWEFVLLEPRVIEMRRAIQTITHAEWKRKLEDSLKQYRELYPDEDHAIEPEEPIQNATQISTQISTSSTLKVSPEEEKDVLWDGLQCFASVPALLSVSHEARTVAAAFYERPFNSLINSENINMNFQHDTLYLYYNKYFSKPGRDTEESENYLPTFDRHVMRRVENLAIRVDRKPTYRWERPSLEEYIATLLLFFTGVKVLTVIFKDFTAGDEAEIALCEPVDFEMAMEIWGVQYEAECRDESIEIHSVPQVFEDPMPRVDVGELERMMSRVTKPCVIPRFDYQVVVPAEHLEFLEWMRDKQHSTRQRYKNEGNPRVAARRLAQELGEVRLSPLCPDNYT
ncbi:hypothetical protein VTL71DRAFT_12697 [Oculimacula yallundae]|uniref:2EXR domain-containing protein n=1 Tax=Oculimacula yallundae TaxID=86028 RepID=A0ABR4CPI7_9HELO